MGSVQDPTFILPARELVVQKGASAASAGAELCYADVGLSFWGGVDPLTSKVVDHTHPLYGRTIAGSILVIPNGRGSCTGSQVVLELLLNDLAPAAIVLRHPDVIVALGVIVADELFSRSIPVVAVGQVGFEEIGAAVVRGVQFATVGNGSVRGFNKLLTVDDTCNLEVAALKDAPQHNPEGSEGNTTTFHVPECLELTPHELAMLNGEASSKATQVAMRIVARAAAIQDAARLVEVKQAHIDSCIYVGPGGLRFVEKLRELGGRVVVPTTLNAISIDQAKWQAAGVSASLGDAAQELANAYIQLGAEATFTCAPYLLDSAPRFGEQIAWSESNAVIFANSVLGARTQKYADFLDVCAALTGRVPAAGQHRSEERQASVCLDARALVAALQREGELGCASAEHADAFFPVLGYLCGLRCEARIAVVDGLQELRPTRDQLKAFAAALGTSGSAAMFHMAGVTPEAPTVAAAMGVPPAHEALVTLHLSDLARAWRALDSGYSSEGSEDAAAVDLVALGNPHMSLEECSRLAALVCGSDCAAAAGACPAGTPRKHPAVRVVVTLGRHVKGLAEQHGYLAALEAFGVEVLTDTCWCMLAAPVVPPSRKLMVTNSAKYAHYAPALVSRRVRFASLQTCVRAACCGTAPRPPAWVEREDAASTLTSEDRCSDGQKNLHRMSSLYGNEHVVAELAAECTNCAASEAQLAW